MDFDRPYICRLSHLTLRIGALILLLGATSASADSAASQTYYHLPDQVSTVMKHLRENPQVLPPQFLPHVTRALGLPEDDPKIQAMFDSKKQLRFVKQRLSEPVRIPTELKYSGLIAHRRNDKGGSPVLTKEEYEQTRAKQDSSFLLMPKSTQKEAAAKVSSPNYLTLKSLGTCEKAKTETKNRHLAPRNKHRAKHTIIDVLFVRPGMKTSSPREIYGTQTEVLIYDPENPSPKVGALASMLNVSCLPYRKRHTNKYRFEHFGEHALRNYDGNPHGKGQNFIQ